MSHRTTATGQGVIGAHRDGEFDILGAYLQEVAAVPLLTPEEEQELGQAVQGGQAALARIRGERLTSEEQARQWRLVARGRTAERRMVEANLRLVVSIAKRYLNRGLALPDLVQEGNLGLLKAVQRFDPRMNYRFSTYATYWIRQAVGRAVMERGRTIRVPAHIYEQLVALRAAALRLQQRLGRTPTLEEVVLASGLLSAEDSQSIALLLEQGAPLPEPLRRHWDRARGQAREMLQIAREPMSLDAPVGLEGDSTLGEVVACDEALSPSEEVFALLLHDSLTETLTSLSPREQLVLRYRFGLEDAETMTLERIGETLGVTRERVRQIEKRALGKLRADAQTRQMLLFMEPS